MMQNFIIGQYVPTGSVIHRLDPRLKIMIVFFFVLVMFTADTWLSYSVLFGFAFLGASLTKIHPKLILLGLKPVWIIVAFTFILHLFLTREGEVLFSILGFNFYSTALYQGLAISARLLLLIFMTTLMTLTTTPIAITDAVEKILYPLSKIKVPVHEIALMMSISLRFIPTLIEETDKISKAQASRGLDISTGSLKDRTKAIIPLLIPLFISAFKRAEDLAIAMEARGYQGGEGRTKYRELRFSITDGIVTVLFLAVVAAFFWTNQ
ncbi:transporter [Halalkalibacillus sediminis]|uniref:Energy-coupling factor transporter transmembrane protein EcfT n=1 Tax=Halalkalibacillus sediminis TaxID=2018042 RepID=A0A2I0QQF8_9BACI|nr:energy-coupling factor transporter transmembrane component T [Halalkalibacillus sediminis]PKR76565.1 transporter [Halalkalibacillus sediminis]